MVNDEAKLRDGIYYSTAGNIESMLSLKAVKHLLGLGWDQLYVLIRQGRLTAYRVSGEPVAKEAVDFRVNGLRVKPSDLREFLRNSEVR